MTARKLRRRALGLGAAMLGAALAVAADSAWVEPRRLVHRRVAAPVAAMPPALDGLTILHVSDFHFVPRDAWLKRRLAELAAETAKAPPDIIALTGDFVEWDEDAPAIAALLAPLRSRFGAFAVLGNHDYGNGVDPHDGDERSPLNRLSEAIGAPFAAFQGRPSKPNGNCAAAVTRALEDAGITVLRNAAVSLPSAGNLWVAGVDEPHQRRADPAAALRDASAREPALLLAHSPEVLERPFPRPVGLILAGHTHGGQIRLPFLRPLVTHTRVPLPAYRGLIATPYGPMYISSGIGATIPLRFRCPPEVTTLTLNAVAAPRTAAVGARSNRPLVVSD